MFWNMQFLSMKPKPELSQCIESTDGRHSTITNLQSRNIDRADLQILHKILQKEIVQSFAVAMTCKTSRRNMKKKKSDNFRDLGDKEFNVIILQTVKESSTLESAFRIRMYLSALDSAPRKPLENFDVQVFLLLKSIENRRFMFEVTT